MDWLWSNVLAFNVPKIVLDNIELYLHFFYLISTLTWHRFLKAFLVDNKDLWIPYRDVIAVADLAAQGGMASAAIILT